MGGLETHIVTFINELLRLRHQILLYTAYVDSYLLTQIEDNDHSFQQLNWSDNPLQDVKGFAPTIIHAHPFTAIIHGYNIARVLNKPFFITMHGLYNFGLDQSPLGNQISKNASRIIAVDQAVANLLKNSITNPEKIMVIPNGIDLNFFQPIPIDLLTRKKYGLEPDWFTITVVSRFDDGKERPILQLLRMAPILANQLGGLNIMIVGDGSCYSRLESTVEQIKQEGDHLKVVLVGRQNDVREFLGMADYVLACDRAALEAMACEKAVFAMNAAGFGSAIDDHNYQEFLLYRSGYHDLTDEKVTAKLLKLAFDPMQRSDLAIKGREIVQRHFNIQDIVSELEDVFRNSV
jgi:glycosyltransferase involved in cell wall biosynthesis